MGAEVRSVPLSFVVRPATRARRDGRRPRGRGSVPVRALGAAVGWVRFRRIGGLHLYSAKAAGAVAYMFGVTLLVFDEYRPLFFYAAAGATALGATEMLLVFLTRDAVDENVGSILLRRRTTGTD
ncbi:MAG TPA: hypothetical protein VFQ76_00390 [Longimicrobiaceae bacterium]|nr:hypothetical protein [Longimicrobiaceae bacterium]